MIPSWELTYPGPFWVDDFPNFPRQYPRKHVEPPATPSQVAADAKDGNEGSERNPGDVRKRRSAFPPGFGGWVMVQVLMV